jgi:hypothetical protein
VQGELQQHGFYYNLQMSQFRGPLLLASPGSMSCARAIPATLSPEGES